MPNKLIRSSLHLQQLKFGYTDKPLEEIISNKMVLQKAKDLGIDQLGIQLSFTENRVLFAIQKLLDEENYKVEKLKINISQFLDAYGVKKTLSSRKKNEYNSRSRSAALRALEKLDGARYLIAYNKVTWPDKKKNVEKVEYISGLFSLEKNGRELVISPSPVLYDQIETHFCWLPEDLFENQIGSSEISKVLFVEYLNYAYDIERKGRGAKKYTLTYTMESWAKKLQLGSLYDARQKGRVRTKLLEAYELGKQLGYLSDYQIDQPGVTVDKNDVLTLNVDMLSDMRSTNKSSKVYHKKSQGLPIIVADTSKTTNI